MTREEAINKVRQMSLPKETIEILEALAPELTESEDERIRKWILEKVQGYVSSGVPCSDEIKMADKAIDYLEKIREKSLIPDELVEGYKKCGLSELVEGAKIVNAINSCYSQNLVLHDTFGYEEGRQTGQNEGVKFVLNNPEKYGLQKPAEWSDEDQENLTWLCGIIHSRLVHKEISLAEASEISKWIDKWINHGPKPEQEWDEFDEDCLNRAIWYVENPAPSVVKDFRLVEWLKSLPLNLKKKNDDVAKLCSNEWSEEDERMLVKLLDSISIGNDYKEMRNWLLLKLKSLRPSWKPSEEQMEALERASMNKYLSAEQFDILVSLYEQLKKL